MADRAEELRSVKREYYRNWRKNNPEKVKAAQERYWQKKLSQAQQENAEENKDE